MASTHSTIILIILSLLIVLMFSTYTQSMSCVEKNDSIHCTQEFSVKISQAELLQENESKLIQNTNEETDTHNTNIQKHISKKSNIVLTSAIFCLIAITIFSLYLILKQS